MFEGLLGKRGLSLERIQTLCLVADAGSIARAAKRDPVKQSQFSRQIRELEDRFGVELVRRVGKSLELTDAGRALARIGKEQLGALDDFARGCQHAKTVFHLGAGDMLLAWLVLPRIRPMHDMAFVLHALGQRAIAEGLRDLRLDFALASSGGTKLGRVRFELFVPRRLLRSRDPEIIVRTVPLALVHGDDEWSVAGLEASLECETFPQAARAVRSGAFAAILPHLARRELRDAAVVDWPHLHALDRPIHLIWSRRAMDLRPHAEVARTELKDLLRFA